LNKRDPELRVHAIFGRKPIITGYPGRDYYDAIAWSLLKCERVLKPTLVAADIYT